MNEITKHKLMWGWLRLLLGFAQMSLVAMAIGSLVTIGLHPLTWVFVLGATLATISSRFLYRGQANPQLKQAKPK